MTAILRTESRRLQRSSIVLLVVFALLSVLYFSMFPELAGEEAEELFEAFPDAMFDLFGIEAIHTIEGFIAAEVYAFFWVILLGIYFAYVGAGTIAGDIEERKMDLTLANPVSRESVLAQKVAAFWVPLLILNTGVPLIVYVGSRLIDEPINGVAIAMVHLLSVPYLLVCAGIGILLSVVIERKRTAQSTALGLVFVLWLIEGTSNLDPDYEWIGYFTPSRYYDPSAILVHEEYAFFDAAVLLAAFLLLLFLAAGIFVRRDI
ncbi:ABC-type transport system permease protein [Halalkaliarchaeum desulfuricum]|uniref:ABC-type transport system permease protein n=1 Tax=Halalkaliarchaeum desulfuricum TaxID=2055893 RepID=A0A343TK03_9EURY|nr:ABC transporter permease subunit [Halalkaliarchaeum desulfuricum]AUX09425.1 ABC-type transport system permease protein [Halalkaliarchaeum desulfuricum]